MAFNSEFRPIKPRLIYHKGLPEREVQHLVYFCDRCGQGFQKPQKHYLNEEKTIKCK